MSHDDCFHMLFIIGLFLINKLEKDEKNSWLYYDEYDISLWKWKGKTGYYQTTAKLFVES
jgi:hypothetical protein